MTPEKISFPIYQLDRFPIWGESSFLPHWEKSWSWSPLFSQFYLQFQMFCMYIFSSKWFLEPSCKICFSTPLGKIGLTLLSVTKSSDPKE